MCLKIFFEPLKKQMAKILISLLTILRQRRRNMTTLKKWYEKNWGIALLLILCFPLGVILLWQNPRYSNQLKGGITASFIFLILFCSFDTHESPQRSSYQKDSSSTQKAVTKEGMIYASTQRSCLCIVHAGDLEGFINAAKRKDAEYIDVMLAKGRAFVIRSNTRVLYSDSGIYQGVAFVTFLEGEHTGHRAYTLKKRIQ